MPRGPRKFARRSRGRVLSRLQERVVRQALADGASDDQARRAAGISARLMYAARLADLADLPRNKRGPRPGVVYEPPPEVPELPVEEIYRRAAEIRAGWTEELRRFRWNPRFSPIPDA